jgi:hypothetical protein
LELKVLIKVGHIGPKTIGQEIWPNPIIDHVFFLKYF